MYTRGRIKKILKDVEKGAVSSKEAFCLLKDLPYKDMGFARIDLHRDIRKGFPEVIFGQGKNNLQLRKIVSSLLKGNQTLMVTRASAGQYRYLKKDFPNLKYNETARIIYKDKRRPRTKGSVLLITGGTSDIPVAEEARQTLQILGNKVSALYDAGVAGVHRVLDKKHLLKKANVIIVVAGMEGALASVVSGLVSRPVIAVPTSVGYGASFKGLAPLLTMMNSCSPGVCVVNIDNGFGAGYLASLINRGNKQ
jgi:NCAIR mutase (PurE)-related protein